jgi:dimethylargininase
MTIALTRAVPPSIAACELTHLEREPIDAARAALEHQSYEQCLVTLGCTIQRLPPLPDSPDSVFVEDTAVVLPELAIITRPGAESRRSEIDSVAEALRGYRPLAFIQAPGTIDGGDVLVIGSTIYVGESGRSNASGHQQLAMLTATYGYEVRSVKLTGCLHLKSAASRVGENIVLVNPDWVDASIFADVRTIDIDPSEPFAANAVWIDSHVIHPAGFDATRKRLEREGVTVHQVDTTELQKAEGGVTCCSILL